MFSVEKQRNKIQHRSLPLCHTNIWTTNPHVTSHPAYYEAMESFLWRKSSRGRKTLCTWHTTTEI